MSLSIASHYVIRASSAASALPSAPVEPLPVADTGAQVCAQPQAGAVGPVAHPLHWLLRLQMAYGLRRMALAIDPR